MYLMHKDTLVLEINNGIKVLNKDLLPFVLKKNAVDYDDFYGNFLSYRAINVSRSYAKELMQQLKISQNNSVKVCLAVHSVSYMDCYWTKEENEEISWKDVSLFQAPPDKDIAKLAFTGMGQMLQVHRLHTPELTTQGLSAKCWNWHNNQCFLYKVSRKELAASELLDQLGFQHLSYQEATSDEIAAITTPKRLEQVREADELIVKCPCMTTESISLVTFEEFSVFCENNNYNPYKFIKEHFPKQYTEMILADYIIGNTDRHIGNWGLLYDTDTMQIIGLHPLMDHDRAFSNEELKTQTLENDVLMKDAVKELILSDDICQRVEKLTRPKGLTDIEWDGVVERAGIVLQIQQKRGIPDIDNPRYKSGRSGIGRR